MRPWARTGPALLVAGVLAVGGCGDDFDAAGERVPVPSELKRRWITDHPRYADRHFEVTDSLLIFGTGEGGVSAERILAVFAREGERETLYQFRYRAGGTQVYDFDVLHDPERGSVRLENQPEVVWWPQGRERPMPEEATARPGPR